MHHLGKKSPSQIRKEVKEIIQALIHLFIYLF